MKGTLMPRPYPPEFRQRAIALVREGRQVKQTAADLGIDVVGLCSLLRQDCIDQAANPVQRRGRVPSCGLPGSAFGCSNRNFQF